MSVFPWSAVKSLKKISTSRTARTDHPAVHKLPRLRSSSKVCRVSPPRSTRVEELSSNPPLGHDRSSLRRVSADRVAGVWSRGGQRVACDGVFVTRLFRHRKSVLVLRSLRFSCPFLCTVFHRLTPVRVCRVGFVGEVPGCRAPLPWSLTHTFHSHSLFYKKTSRNHHDIVSNRRAERFR